MHALILFRAHLFQLLDAGFGEKIELLQRVRGTENYDAFHEVVDNALGK